MSLSERFKDVRTYSSDERLVEQRRSEIIVSACAVFVKNGYDRTTMNQLAKAFGMSKGGMYHYIGSKDDILYLIIKYNKEKQQEFIKKIEGMIVGMNPAESLRTAIESHLDRLEKYQDVYIFVGHIMPNLQKEERQSLFEDSLRLTGYFEKMVIKGKEAGVFAVEDTWIAASAIVSLCGRWANIRWSLKKRYTLGEYKKALVTYILRSLDVKNITADTL